MSKTIQIKHRFTEAVLFECDAPDGLDSGMQQRHALEKAVSARANLYEANLRGANLGGAYLDGADLRGAYLDGADLCGADLRVANLYGAYLDGAGLRGANLYGANLGGAYLGGADLRGAYLDGADLRGAYLGGANLDGANLDGADLGDKKLIGERPVMMIGPIGSRADYFTAYLTDAGIYLRAGCFSGTVSEFTEKLDAEHGDNAHGQEYRAALALIECHAKLWTPAVETQEAA